MIFFTDWCFFFFALIFIQLSYASIFLKLSKRFHPYYLSFCILFFPLHCCYYFKQYATYERHHDYQRWQSGQKIGGFGFWILVQIFCSSDSDSNFDNKYLNFEIGKIYLEWQQQSSTNDKTFYLNKITFIVPSQLCPKKMA